MSSASPGVFWSSWMGVKTPVVRADLTANQVPWWKWGRRYLPPPLAPYRLWRGIVRTRCMHMRQHPPREVPAPRLWLEVSSLLPQKQPLSPTPVGGGRLPAAGDFNLMLPAYSWDGTITACSRAKLSAGVSQTQHQSAFSVSQPALRHAVLLITTWMEEQSGWRDGQNQECFQSNPRRRPGTSSGAFVPMGSKRRSTDMQAMLGNSTSGQKGGHGDGLPQPILQQSQV